MSRKTRGLLITSVALMLVGIIIQLIKQNIPFPEQNDQQQKYQPEPH